MSQPGWHKDARIKLANGLVVTLLDDGEYRPFYEPGVSGMLWYYLAEYPDGRTGRITPMAGDAPIQVE